MKIQMFEKIALFRHLFTGLRNVYGTYDPASGRCWQVKAPVTDKVIRAHLLGHRPYGVYPLTGEKTHFIAVDFDIEDRLPPKDFVDRGRHYGFSAYIERSKSKGFHVWIFFEAPGVLAQEARLVVGEILRDINQSEVEVFPKQNALRGGVRYGSFINAPLYGSLITKGRTVFLCPDTLKPYPDQWEFLKTIRKVSLESLRCMIEVNSWEKTDSVRKVPPRETKNSHTWGLPPCAKKMLEEGVENNQRVSCFRLAVQLKKVGIPQDISLEALRAWARKNRPGFDKEIITDREIHDQVGWAYRKEYRGCGCEDPAVAPYCDPRCPIYSKVQA